jgi:uncharacterized protein
MDKLTFKLITLNNSPNYNLILAQSHFIKTVEDVHELMVTAVPGARFGLAFNEASGPRLIRRSGTKPELVKEAVRIAKLLASGHLLVIALEAMYPINVLPRLKENSEIVQIFCATANPVQVVMAVTNQGRGVMGVIDGEIPIGEETAKDVQERQAFLRQIGYKT